MSETPGQQAARLIREARAVLADPSKAEYHDRLRAAADAMERELDWWRQLAAAMREDKWWIGNDDADPFA